MKRFDVRTETPRKFWVMSRVTGRVFLVEFQVIGIDKQDDSQVVFTRIMEGANDGIAKKAVVGSIRLRPEIDPLPFLVALDQMTNTN